MWNGTSSGITLAVCFMMMWQSGWEASGNTFSDSVIIVSSTSKQEKDQALLQWWQLTNLADQTADCIKRRDGEPLPEGHYLKSISTWMIKSHTVTLWKHRSFPWISIPPHLTPPRASSITELAYISRNSQWLLYCFIWPLSQPPQPLSSWHEGCTLHWEVSQAQ